MLAYHYKPLTQAVHGGFWTVITKNFEVSGYDPYLLLTASRWSTYYELFRHPLISLIFYPAYLLNQFLIDLTGVNCAVHIIGTLLLLCNGYTFVFFFRIFHKLLSLNRWDAALLSFFVFGCAHILLATLVPDHFGFSLFFLSLLLYLSGRAMQQGKYLSPVTQLVLMLFTAGITTNNGAKVWLSALWVNKRQWFTWRNIVYCLLLPGLVFSIGLAYQYEYLYKPRMAFSERMIQIRMEKDPTFAAKIKEHQQKNDVIKGKPMEGNPILKWTDTSISRSSAVWHNLLGESIQLHQDHLLQDLFQGRPFFVSYRFLFQYGIEIFCILLLTGGIIVGVRSPLMQLCLSWAFCDFLLHILLGFGLNEVYIMSAHWLFMLPLATAYLLKNTQGRTQQIFRLVLVLLVTYLWIYNGSLIGYYLVTT